MQRWQGWGLAEFYESTGHCRSCCVLCFIMQENDTVEAATDSLSSTQPQILCSGQRTVAKMPVNSLMCRQVCIAAVKHSDPCWHEFLK